MSWQDAKSENDLIDATEFTNQANTVEWVSSNYYNHSSNRDVHFPSSSITPWLDNVYLSNNSSINVMNDVDTSSDTPQRDEVLKWNGTNWVPTSYDTTFEFSISSFSDGESTTQLIGIGTWKSIGAMSYTATYNNGPPDNSDVYVGYNSTNYWKSGVIGTMDGANSESGDNDVAVSYPDGKDKYLRFRLSANASTDTDIDNETAIYFRNYIFYGALNKNDSITESDIEGLSTSLSNDHTNNFSINAGAGEYLIFAHPKSYTYILSGSDYEDNGTSGFRFNSMTVAMSGSTDVNITNTAGYAEDYAVYVSKLTNLGNSTLTTSTTSNTINEIYYGVTSKTSSYTESDVEGLANSPITDDSTQTWSEVTAGAGEYLLFCFPKRWGEKGTDYSFYDNGTGFEASFESAETVSVTNSQGWTEDFYVYRSENANLGAITIRTS